jgi:hypothetical protein
MAKRGAGEWAAIAALWAVLGVCAAMGAFALDSAALHARSVARGWACYSVPVNYCPYAHLFPQTKVILVAAAIGGAAVLVTWAVWAILRLAGRTDGGMTIADAVTWLVEAGAAAGGAWLLFYALQWRADRGNAQGVPWEWTALGESPLRLLVGPALALLAATAGYVLRRMLGRAPSTVIRRGIARGALALGITGGVVMAGLMVFLVLGAIAMLTWTF